MPNNRVQLLDIAELDDDHLKLAAIIAEMELCIEKELATNAGQLLEPLLTAARRHFQDEERLMAQTEYPLLAKHQEGHAELLRFMEGVIGRVANGQLRVDTELIAKLWYWELEHIDTSDQQYADYLKQHRLAVPAK